MCLARPGLPVRKEADVIPVEGALYEFRHLLEHHILSRRGCEYLVKLESVILTDVLAKDGEALPMGEDVDGEMPRRPWAGRAVRNVPPQLAPGCDCAARGALHRHSEASPQAPRSCDCAPRSAP